MDTAGGQGDAASAAAAQQQPQPTSRRRVKLYKLVRDQWTDQGTGHVTSTYEEATDTLSLLVKSEDNGATLIQTKVFADDIYQRQQDTLVVWCDPETGEDLALSFQELTDCREIWDLICDYQSRHQTTSALTEAARDASEGEAGSLGERSSSCGEGWQALVELDLPRPSIATLREVAAVICENSDARKASLAACLLKQAYVPKLIEVFEQCEDVEDQEALKLTYSIFKTLIMLNDPSVMEVLFCDENILKVLGALEYDPDINPADRMCHRDFVTKQTTFKEVVPFNNPELVSKIHQTFRLQYIKDVVLPRVLDDPTCATLNSLIFFNQLEIVTHVQNDVSFQEQLFLKLEISSYGSDERKDLMTFLHELFNLAKNLQPSNRTQFFRTITAAGLFDSMDDALGDERFETRMATTEVLGITLMHDPSLLRSFLLQQRSKKLLNEILSRFFRDDDVGIMGVCSDILKALLDTETMVESAEKQPFVELIYNDILPMLIPPLAGKGMDTNTQQSQLEIPPLPKSVEGQEALLVNICELLGFCVVRHGFHMRSFMIMNDVLKKASRLLNSPHKHLVLSALRFLKTVIATKDETYLRHIVDRNLFKKVMNLFKHNATRYNLINSTVIDLLEFVRHENLKIVVAHVVERYGSYFKDITYVDTFSKLILRYEQNKEYEERPPGATLTAPPATLAIPHEDSEEEHYFNDTDSDDDTSSAPASAAPAPAPAAAATAAAPSKAEQPKKLVDYADDEEETTTAMAKEGGGGNGGQMVVDQEAKALARAGEEITGAQGGTEVDGENTRKRPRLS